MNVILRLSPFVAVLFLVAGCATNSRVVTDPPGFLVSVNGQDFGKSPSAVQSIGTTFGEYLLELRDDTGNVVFARVLPKKVRIWGIFWPPYGVFFNLFQFFPQYTVTRLNLKGGQPGACVLAKGLSASVAAIAAAASKLHLDESVLCDVAHANSALEPALDVRTGLLRS